MMNIQKYKMIKREKDPSKTWKLTNMPYSRAIALHGIENVAFTPDGIRKGVPMIEVFCTI